MSVIYVADNVLWQTENHSTIEFSECKPSTPAPRIRLQIRMAVHFLCVSISVDVELNIPISLERLRLDRFEVSTCSCVRGTRVIGAITTSQILRAKHACELLNGVFVKLCGDMSECSPVDTEAHVGHFYLVLGQLPLRNNNRSCAHEPVGHRMFVRAPCNELLRGAASSTLCCHSNLPDHSQVGAACEC